MCLLLLTHPATGRVRVLTFPTSFERALTVIYLATSGFVLQLVDAA